MINSITLTNFKRHESLAISFEPGFTAIRGNNEQGKSTVLLAIAYALFGTKAIPDSLDDTVTWGKPTSSLRVDIEFTLDGVSYKLRRSKASCQLDYSDQTVTGQTEVTAFVARLLKVDAGAAARLTIANQSAIRGALEAGPKATTELIERLSEFDQIDNLIELMQEKLTLGSTAGVVAATDSAKADLARAEALAVPVDLVQAQDQILAARGVWKYAEGVTAGCEVNEGLLQEAHSKLREMAVRRDGLSRDVTKAREVQRAAQTRLDALVAPVEPTNVDARVTALQKQIADAEQADHIASVFSKVRPYLSEPKIATFEGSHEDLRTEIANTETLVRSHADKVITLRGDIKLLEATLTHGTCTFCGKDFSGVPEVALRNADTTRKLEEADSSLTLEVRAHRDGVIDLGLLKDVLEADIKVANVLAAAGDLAEYVDLKVLPRYLKWNGPEVGATVDVGALRRDIKALQEAVVNFARARAQRDAALSAVVVADAAVAAAQFELSKSPEVAMGDAQKDLDDARDATRAARKSEAEAKSLMEGFEAGLRDQQTAYAHAVKEVRRATERVETLGKDLETLEFNNALLKRVRVCRPLLADKLWTLVLAASSSYFSDIRGVKSRVTKDSDGFQIDGHPVSSMSGSTLDALGLAIRVALVRTFLPSSPFLVLDEPSSAMDGDRTGNMLGFLSKIGFNQIILVTHEDLSETVADHIITLGD